MITILISTKAFCFETKAKWAILSDSNTGTLLYSKNASEKMPPSSMTKLMTIYMVFEALKDGTTKLGDQLLVSEKAWKEPGSRMFVLPNSTIPVEDLLRGVIVQSGNDASVVLAEGVAGSESVFVDRMNIKAKALGMNNTHFVNATGLPHPEHYMTSEDLLILSNRIIQDFPEYYSYFAEKEFTHNKIKQQNRNLLLFKDIGVDGLKTGHTEVGGYGIAASATKNGRRLVAVVNGCKNEGERLAEVQKLLQYGFMNFVNIDVVKKNQPIATVDVMYGKDPKVDLVIKKDVVITVPVDYKGSVKAKAQYPSFIESSASINDVVGTIEVEVGNGQKQEFYIYPAKDVQKSGWFGRTWNKLKYIISNMSLKTPKITVQHKNLV
jgi:D-alanyl-D-alanine carboxypeptidase (penicillin-binding protein 5/6)